MGWKINGLDDGFSFEGFIYFFLFVCVNCEEFTVEKFFLETE